MTGPDVAVTSRSFSRHPLLQAELLERYPGARLNDGGASLRGDALVDFLRGCSKAITALEPVDDALLDELPELQVISKVGVGIDMIDLDSMERHGVRLGWTPGTNARSVAELVIAMAMSLLRHLPEVNSDTRAGGWQQVKGATLSGRTVGIVGYGSVGRDVAHLAASFGCPILACDALPLTDLPDGTRAVSLDDLLVASDVVTLHVGLNAETAGLIDAQRLALMKPTAILLNTARGGLVDEDALAQALVAGRLGGAGLDVFATEPPAGSSLLSLPNVIATPHIGGSTEEAIVAMGRAAIAGLETADTIAAVRARLGS